MGTAKVPFFPRVISNALKIVSQSSDNGKSKFLKFVRLE